jgi:uncharacterized protein (TIGR02271 family)
MPTLEDIKSWRGRTVVDSDGDKIGSIEDIYLDRQSGEPEWAAIKTGLLGTKVSFAPLRDASEAGDDVRVPYSKDQVKDAPSIEADGELSPDEEQRLYEHYGRSDYGDWDRTTDRTEGVVGREERFSSERGGEVRTTGTDADLEDESVRTARGTDVDADRESVTTGRGTVDEDTTGRATDDAMTRSEEELRVGTSRSEVGRARLRKYVETEDVEETVPVSREEARVEREPITDANVEQAMSGPDITEAEHEVTLEAEEPVVEKRTVPKERVRLDKETITDEETVSDEVRKERIEAEGDADDRR